MTRDEAIRFVILRSLGNFLVLFSLYGVFATLGPALTQEMKYRIIQVRGVSFAIATPESRHCNRVKGTGQPQTNSVQDEDCSYLGTSDFVVSRNDDRKNPGFADVLAGNKEQVLIPKDPMFSILIPKIGAAASVFPNVDPENPSEFLPILQIGVAHAKGSVFPGHVGNTYLFAHSADNWWSVGRYNAVFYTLHNLSVNDEIVVFFENRRYDYSVSQKVISDPNDTTLLRGPVKSLSATQSASSEQLVLQTCWPPGTTWKRLYIIASPKRTK